MKSFVKLSEVKKQHQAMELMRKDLEKVRGGMTNIIEPIAEKYGVLVEKYGVLVEKYGVVVEKYGVSVEKYGVYVDDPFVAAVR